MAIFPAKLKSGDKIMVIAPSRSLSILNDETVKVAMERFTDLGLRVEISKHAREMDEFNSSSIKSRVEDINSAFSSSDIDAVFTVIGGFNGNQLLRYLDFKTIGANPKIFCGYSDITILQNSIYAKTGLVTYSGPHFSSFGMRLGFDYTLDYLNRCLFSTGAFEVKPSMEWSDDRWHNDQVARKFIRNDGYNVINFGKAEGTIIGGNLCTFNLLQGTEFMPKLKGSILFIEDDYETRPHIFDRDLQSLIHQPGFEDVRGIVIGRFQTESKMTAGLLDRIIKTKKELDGIPVISGVDFGHTTPQITYPVGGTASLEAGAGGAVLKVLKH